MEIPIKQIIQMHLSILSGTPIVFSGEEELFKL